MIESDGLAKAPPLRAAAYPASRGRWRFNLEIRQQVSAWRQMAVLIAGMAAGCGVAALILVASGVGFADLATEFVFNVFSSRQNFSAVLVQTAPLLIVGLSAAVAFRVRFWNIGIEGQMIFGSIAATAIAISNAGPEWLRLVLMILAAAIAGMAWIVVPVLLKLRLGLNEIISTLLLNYVAFNFLLHLLYGGWRDPQSGFPNSELFDSVERLPGLGWENLTLSLPLAILLAVVCWWYLNVSRIGFFTKFANANPSMARAAGIPLTAVILGSALLSGALSGIAGFAVSAGIEYRMTQSFFVGYGFSGILIAFIARNNPVGAIAIAFFMAVLFVAGQSMQVFYQIPGSMVQLIQAIVVICVAGSEFFLRHRIRLIRQERP
jgi:ABC-type uncharacterized transport system permease subunit